MSESNSEQVSGLKCDYCGKAYVAGAGQCSGCGKSLATGLETPPMPKSQVIAMLLALYFGPLGLLYLVARGRMVVLLFIGLGILFFPLLFAWTHMSGIGWLVALVARVACVSFVLGYLKRQAGAHNVEGQAEILLNEAVNLEHRDFGLAMAKYEEVIAQFPNSRASKAAKTCLETIKQNN